MRKSSKVQQDRDAAKRVRILNDPDFINAPSYGNSLEKVRQSHPEGVPEKDIEKYLLMTKEEIVTLRTGAIEKIRRYLRK